MPCRFISTDCIDPFEALAVDARRMTGLLLAGVYGAVLAIQEFDGSVEFVREHADL